MNQVLRSVALVTTLCAVSISAGCGGSEETGLTVYLKRNLGSSGPPGQIAPVLSPAVRDRSTEHPTPAEVLAHLRLGPTNAEREEGFLPTIPPSVRVLAIQVYKRTATVNLGGSPAQNFYTHAAIVFSLTELPGIDAVTLHYKGKPCCVYNLEGEVMARPLTRVGYHGWPGEPCALRTYPDAVKCRSAD